jgi:hypothetical protein
LRKRNHYIWISANAVHHAPTVLQTHSGLSLAFGGTTDGIDGVQHRFHAAIDVDFDCLKRCIDETVPIRRPTHLLPVGSEHNASLRALTCFTVLGQRYKTVLLANLPCIFLTNQDQYVFVKNFYFRSADSLNLANAVFTSTSLTI